LAISDPSKSLAGVAEILDERRDRPQEYTSPLFGMPLVRRPAGTSRHIGYTAALLGVTDSSRTGFSDLKGAKPHTFTPGGECARGEGVEDG
jgi:hypothetical protein